MEISDYIAQLTGKTADVLFSGVAPLVRIQQNNGVLSVAYWDASLGVPAPTSAALAAAVTALPPMPSLIAYATTKRYNLEVGGITVNGIAIATDDRSKQMIMGARIAATANPNFTTSWAVGSQTYQLTASQIIAISDAVLAHVAACFSAFATIVSGINGGTITTTAAIDAAFASGVTV